MLPVLQAPSLAGEGTAWHHPPTAATENYNTSFCEDQAAARATVQGDDGQPANTKTVAELLAGFFHYFGWAFPYRTQVVCVRTGEPFPKTSRGISCSFTKVLFTVLL